MWIIIQKLIILSMNLSSVLKKYSKQKHSMYETKKLIREMREKAPVLSTIVDYGGSESVRNILKLNESDHKKRNYNPFAKIIK